MIDPDYLANFAEKYFSQDAGKTVPLDLLRAWLSCEHMHTEDGEPFILSLRLDEWAREVAK